MRRFVLVFLMLLLPLQWGWAAAASVCAHEAGGAHIGHHEHAHAKVPGKATADAGKSDASPFGASHADCHACHGMGNACVAILGGADNDWNSSAALPLYSRAVPEPPIENLLRPPSRLVA